MTPRADLPPTGCRWIDGDPDGIATRWCDKPLPSPLESYCATHRARTVKRAQATGDDVRAALVRPVMAQRAGTVRLWRGDYFRPTKVSA
jgi:hypothetical protein